MELTHEQLAESCTRNNLTAYICGQDICGQDYWATLEDAKENEVEPDRQKVWTMEQMLIENLDFGKYYESDDKDFDDWHSERMEVRYDILDKVVDSWVAGEFSGKEKTELQLAQELVDKELAELD
jgi:hypothetical protein